MARVRIAALTAATAGAALLAAGPAAAETTPPVIRSLTVSGPAVVDTTYGYASVKVRVRITDAGSGVRGSEVATRYTRAASANPASFPSTGWTNSSGRLTRVSGTAADGIYETLGVADGGTRGTWGLTIRATDIDGNRTTLTTQQIAAKGWTSSFSSETTTVPAAPEITSNVLYPSVFYPHIGANITFNQPAGTPYSNAAIRVSALPACGTPQPGYPVSTFDYFLDKRLAEECTVVYRAVNAAGVSPEATHSFR